MARNPETTVNITRGILFGWRGKPLVKSRGKRGDTRKEGEYRRHEKLETLHESFLRGGRHSPRDSRV